MASLPASSSKAGDALNSWVASRHSKSWNAFDHADALSAGGMSLPVVVAIPAKNEEEHIRPCLVALDGQNGASVDHVVVYANNCTDATAAAARSVNLRSGMTVQIVEETLPPHLADAGFARRRAMEVSLPQSKAV
jgi:hypothetical protein